MKKWIALFMSLVLTLGLCACGGKEASQPQATQGTQAPETTEAAATFQVGFGRVNITPTPNTGVQMGGYKNQVSTGVLSYIYATCVAITDAQGATLLLYTADLTDMDKTASDLLRAKLTEATGIPGENITVSCTHTHSAPSKGWLTDNVDKLVEAGQAALADRAPATAQIGTYEVPDMNWDRHYYMKDGTIAGDNYGKHSVGYESHYSDADKAMRLIRFVREGDKKDVLMVNWQVHPKLTSTADTEQGNSTRTMFSADFIAYTRDLVEAKEDVLFAYYNGASGNVNPFSKLEAERNIVSKEGKVYGEQFGEHVIKALADLKPVETGNVAATTKPLAEGPFELHAYNVGSSLGFAVVPAEIFHQTGTQIREGSPYEMTFVITCANGRNTYIPIKEAWEFSTNDGSVVYEASICRYAQGTAEALAKDLGDMLTALAGN